MKDKLIQFSLLIILEVGVILLVSPFMLYWWIHGNYDRYVWIINGPYPYSHFGGGPFQVAMYLGLFLGGITLMTLYFVCRRLHDKSKINKS